MVEAESDLDKVSRWWAQTPEQLQQRTLIAWMGHEHIQRYINRRTTGDEALDWFSYILRKYFPTPVARALSLGCGEGGLEHHALAAGAVESFDAYDASQGAIETAQRTATELGLQARVNYGVTDVNRLQLAAGAYDAAFASMSIRHSLPHTASGGGDVGSP